MCAGSGVCRAYMLGGVCCIGRVCVRGTVCVGPMLCGVC